MADPRGLSGAVFQPTQLRDFTKDLLVSNQYKAKKEAAAQKQDDDYYSQFNTGDIKNQSHRDFYQSRILQPLKQQQQVVAELRLSKPNSPEHRAAQSRLENMSKAAISLPAGLNALDATAAKNRTAFNDAYEKGYVTDEAADNVDAYGRFVDGIDARYEGSYFDEKGDLIVEGQYYTQALRPQEMTFKEPYDLRSDITEYYSVKRRDGIIDRGDIFKELNRARGSKRQEKQFYNYLKEQKGYDEDRIQSAIKADSEGLVEEFYEFAAGELMSEKDETTKTEKEEGGASESWKTLGRVGDGTYGKALFLPKDKIKFDLKEFVNDGTNAAELVTDATIISLQPNENGDNILAEISYLKEDGFKEFDFVPLTADQESIIAAGLGLPDNVSIRDFYQNRVGGSTPTKGSQKPQEEKTTTPQNKGLMSGF